MKKSLAKKFISFEEVKKGLEKVGYICSRQIATVSYMAYHLEKPVLVEGPAGVGKTELAKAMAAYASLPLIRLQCYEGLDESKALYEWKYGKQLLYTQILKERLNEVLEGSLDLAESIHKLHQYNDIFFSKLFLEPRPLLQALQQEEGSILLVDEIDKSDQEFEAFLLEILSDYQVSVPEIGTIVADNKPLVFLTSNRTREMSEALKRRCLHLFIPFPGPNREIEIIRSRVPGLSKKLRDHAVSFVHQIRKMDLKKPPSVSETIDWAKAILLLNASELDKNLVKSTLNILLKFEEDISTIGDNVNEILRKAQHEARI